MYLISKQMCKISLDKSIHLNFYIFVRLFGAATPTFLNRRLIGHMVVADVCPA